MDMQIDKEVHFHEFCKKCKYEKTEDTEKPCDECLGEPFNQNSHRPVKYEKKGTKR